ncbi:MAG: ParB/RepB/Spo0J family partition protein [Balneolaceae bacterium]
MSKKVLGRGLGAFFPEYGDSGEQSEGSGQKEANRPVVDPKERVNVVLQIPVGHIRPNPNQPRTHFNETALEQLASSLKEHGLIQPVTVRYLGEKRFELVSGERRLRAARLAGMTEIPAYIREVEDDQLLALALIENIQREELNPIEVAIGYQRMIDELNYTQGEVASSVGKSRTTVTNQIRLLQLPDFIQAALRDDRITTGHARALIHLKSEDQQKALLKKIEENELSVRELEVEARKLDKKRETGRKNKPSNPGIDPFIKDISERLRRTLSTRVDLKTRKNGGEIRISYYSDEDLERLLQLFESIG